MDKNFKPSSHDMRPGASMSACTSDLCKGGRKACPCPEACRINTPMWWQHLERMSAKQFLVFWFTVVAACVSAAVLWANYGPR